MEIAVALHQSYPHPQVTVAVGAVLALDLCPSNHVPQAVGVMVELALPASLHVCQQPADVLPPVAPQGYLQLLVGVVIHLHRSLQACLGDNHLLVPLDVPLAILHFAGLCGHDSYSCG